MDFRIFQKLLFSNIDPTVKAFVDTPLGELKNCTRHQLVIAITPAAAAGTVKVRGLCFSTQLPAAAFDSRLDAISMATLGTQAFVFYGLFDALRFDFSGFAGGSKLAAEIVSHQSTLKWSGNAP